MEWPKSSVDELNHGVSDDYSYVLNQISKFEKVMKNNSISYNDNKYFSVRSDLIKSFRKFHLYMEKRCGEIDCNSGFHYKPKQVSVSGDMGVFEARRELMQEYSKIVKDMRIFDMSAEILGINVCCRDYIHKKRDLEESFDDYYFVVDGKLKNGEF